MKSIKRTSGTDMRVTWWAKDFGATDAQDHGTAAMGADWSVIFAQKLPQNPS